jgi:hypothetical protein
VGFRGFEGFGGFLGSMLGDFEVDWGFILQVESLFVWYARQLRVEELDNMIVHFDTGLQKFKSFI